jgi:RNA polymerase sigma-70 factor, ECF subfamily
VIDLLWEPETFAPETPREPRAPAELAQPQAVATEPDPAELAQARLVAGLRRGEPRAFEELYRQLVRGIYALALRLTCQPAEAEELTQEVFARAWEARQSFSSHAHFKNWLRRVSVNEWINRLRRHRHVALDDEEGAGAQTAARLASPPGSPGLRLDLERALALMSPRLRAVLLLFDLYGLEHAEIGELLGMTVGASKVQLHRARRRLRELMT